LPWGGRAREYFGIQPIYVREDEGIDKVIKELRKGKQVQYQVPLKLCRGLKMVAFSLGANSLHPFVLTAKEYSKNKNYNYSSSLLKEYYKYIKVKNAAKLLGLSEDSSSRINFTELDAIEAILPWEEPPNKNIRKVRNNRIIKEARSFGVDLSGSKGWKVIGPLPDKIGEFEFLRICLLFDSINNEGYKPEKHITGTLLYIKKNNTYSVVINHGQHRAAVLTALDYSNATILFKPNKFVIREEAANWVNVKSGLFSVDKALTVFDRIFKGEQPSTIERNWNKIIKIKN